MDTSPRILQWGFSAEENEKLDAFLQELSAPPLVTIDPDQGHLAVHEILFSDKRSMGRFISDQKVVLFYNVPPEVIHRIMSESKKRDLPKPIYAMVTRENITWNFSDLVAHLKKEHEFVQKRLKEKREER
jgi:hypothetical protein